MRNCEPEVPLRVPLNNTISGGGRDTRKVLLLFSPISMLAFEHIAGFCGSVGTDHKQSTVWIVHVILHSAVQTECSSPLFSTLLHNKDCTNVCLYLGKHLLDHPVLLHITLIRVPHANDEVFVHRTREKMGLWGAS